MQISTPEAIVIVFSDIAKYELNKDNFRNLRTNEELALTFYPIIVWVIHGEDSDNEHSKTRVPGNVKTRYHKKTLYIKKQSERSIVLPSDKWRDVILM